ncbi:poly(A)-binding protein binding protein [Elasticomyces elasticus]|nr:poly(A)-binding protein binding protein [Elasticomyces elasticus]
MSHGFLEPEWTSAKRFPTYKWREVEQQIQHSGSQASHISLQQRRRGKSGPWRPELFVCKWYSTRARPDGIHGSKYIDNEWKTLSGVQHPNIVRYEDFSYDPTGPRLAKLFMEYCDGGDLSQFMKARPGQDDNRLEYRETVQVFNQIAQALLYLHHGVYRFDGNLRLATFVNSEPEAETVDTGLRWQAILHRDIKPANVFVSQRTNDDIKVKLGDFGIAKFETDGTDTYLGSRDFLAPEQRTATVGGRRTTLKSDIYALAVTIGKVSTLNDRLKDDNALGKALEVTRLLLQCCEHDDTLRLTSAVVLDKLTPLVGDVDDMMIRTAVNKILDWEIGNGASGDPKLAWQPTELLELLRRLLAAGSGPMDPALDRAVAYSNRQLETLEHTPPAGNSQCSTFKMSLVLDTISLLRSHGASGTVQQYKLGNLDYSTLQASPAAQLSLMLLRTLQTKIAPSGAYTKEAIVQEIQTTLSYNDILNLTLDDSTLSKAVTNAEARVMLRDQENEAKKARTVRKKGSLTTEDDISRTIDAFKLFANNEKLKIRQAQELKRAGARQGRTEKLQDLKEFAANFKLNSRVPDDLLPILANDQYKQKELRRKGEEAARDAESRGMKEETDDERTERLIARQAAADALHEAHETGTVSLRDVQPPMIVRTPPAQATEKLPRAPVMPARTWATIAASGARPTSSPLAPALVPVSGGITPSVTRPQRAPAQAPGIPRSPRRLPRGGVGPNRKSVVEGDQNRRA